MFKRILIANRGEIACRIIRSCRRLGVETVAVYSDADADALHVRMADRAIHIGGAPPGESYLVSERIIEAARHSHAEAVHPGYGFLAENAAFARACADAGLVFIGPSPETIDRMGSKADAKATMEAAGVPTVPGYHGDDQEPKTLAAEAGKIGYPLMVKAAAGGGGKGMRIVRGKADFDRALQAAKRESANAFGDDRVILERYIEQPRHIEVQVFGDTHGNVIHLFERDCSSQRRYQKIIEEAPAPGLSDDTRAAIHAAAVQAARAVDYVNAGTVELIVGTDEFFFMEMNTRLQVEHPVTEAITGQDLVEWQLRVAAGEPLPVTQEQLTCDGHAIEARLYAEDPASGFLPSSGTIGWLAFPELARIDTGVYEGAEVTVHYDPLIAKLITWGSDRREALVRLRRALRQTAVAGLKTNLDFLAALTAHSVFRNAEIHTAYLDHHLDEVLPPDGTVPDKPVFAAAIAELMAEEEAALDAQVSGNDPYSPWGLADGWRPGHVGKRVISLRRGDEHHLVEAFGFGGDYRLQFNAARIDIEGARLEATRLSFRVDGERDGLTLMRQGPLIQAATDDRIYAFVAEDPYAGDEPIGASEDRVLAPMPGRIASLKVAQGDTVDKDQEVAVMEAMKMELSLTAPRAGTVKSVDAAEGDFVEADTVLVELE